ncbi:hypothetical protein VP01_1096g4 [Puccinia sorghi]|uniref:Uncharacterized protein n=1 Tax=Puccinia sorghi TaxID=27349 RepID=A0A0L6VTA3_9BASI|nr:hypothetical protein VP01_1096g4 [Puccinia sorghi]
MISVTAFLSRRHALSAVAVPTFVWKTVRFEPAAPCSSGNLQACSCNKETGCGCTSSILPKDAANRCVCAASGKTCSCAGCGCKDAPATTGSCCASSNSASCCS